MYREAIGELRRRLARMPPVPTEGAADARWSVVSSAVDQPGPSNELMGLLLTAAERARGLRLADLEQRSEPGDAAYINVWPGEHYRLLAALAAVARPRTVVEIGTFRGHGALALLAGFPTSTVVTYDLLPWSSIPGTVLAEADLAPGLGRPGVLPRTGDLVDPAVRQRDAELLSAADLIFLDGPKDGTWEGRFCTEVLPLLADRPRLVVLDDIRLLEMVQLWRDLPYDKLDATSLGHWSGTGLLRLTPSRQQPAAH